MKLKLLFPTDSIGTRDNTLSNGLVIPHLTTPGNPNQTLEMRLISSRPIKSDTNSEDLPHPPCLRSSLFSPSSSLPLLSAFTTSGLLSADTSSVENKNVLNTHFRQPPPDPFKGYLSQVVVTPYQGYVGFPGGQEILLGQCNGVVSGVLVGFPVHIKINFACSFLLLSLQLGYFDLAIQLLSYYYL